MQPFARYADDEDLNADLRERERWGDPMAYLAALKVRVVPVSPCILHAR